MAFESILHKTNNFKKKLIVAGASLIALFSIMFLFVLSADASGPYYTTTIWIG